MKSPPQDSPKEKCYKSIRFVFDQKTWYPAAAEQAWKSSAAERHG
ncbi:hypothetical protein [Paenibacillus massiliensis]|nr:hypothetical protein [Paenibacillus massiliensis]